MTGRKHKLICNAVKHYERNAWDDPHSKSGSGSQVSLTAHIRSAIPKLIRLANAKVVLDGACGDMHWMRHVDFGEGVGT